MLRIIVAIASGMLFVSCKTQTEPTDAHAASAVGTASLSVACAALIDNSSPAAGRGSVELTISKEKVTIVRTVNRGAGLNKQISRQSIEGKINSVFDFNSLSKDSARLLLNPTDLKTSENGHSSERKLPYDLLEYSQGKLKVSERDAKVIFTQSGCKTKS